MTLETVSVERRAVEEEQADEGASEACSEEGSEVGWHEIADQMEDAASCLRNLPWHRGQAPYRRGEAAGGKAKEAREAREVKEVKEAAFDPCRDGAGEGQQRPGA